MSSSSKKNVDFMTTFLLKFMENKGKLQKGTFQEKSLKLLIFKSYMGKTDGEADGI